MAKVLNYLGKEPPHSLRVRVPAGPHICGSSPRPSALRRVLRWFYPLLLLALLAVPWAVYENQSWKNEWLAVSREVGGFLPADRILHYEHSGFQDPISHHVLELTPQTYNRLYLKASVPPGAKEVHVGNLYWLGGPSWWTIPKNAELFDRNFVCYAFVKETRTVYIYHWSM